MMSPIAPDTRLKGIALSPGVAIGRVCHCVRYTKSSGRSAVNVEDHSQRLKQALVSLQRERDSLAQDTETRLGRESAEIFNAHSMILTDPTFQEALFKTIADTGCSATVAVEQGLGLLKKQLAEADSEYLRQRVDDIEEIEQGLLDFLNHVVTERQCREALDCSLTECRLGNDHILVSRELTATLAIETDRHTAGFVIEKGGANSHGVILARSLGRPAVGNIDGLPGCMPMETDVLIDGDRGEIILNPSPETLDHYPSSLRNRRSNVQASEPVPGLRVMANIQRSTDIEDVLASGAEGIGLYRTEIELLVEGRLLSEEEQLARYREVVRAMAGKPVCIRLLDLGADKMADWLEESAKACTGQRGARLLLSCPDLLRDQARALARASEHGPVDVLYPMIVDADQFLTLRRLFDAAVADLEAGELRHGVLFEIPSACLTAREILEIADFGCIGTNDLIHYLFAKERGCGRADRSDIECDAILWSLIRSLARAAAGAGKHMAICGELAGNPALLEKIVQAGIDTVSTSPSYIAKMRQAASEAQ